MRQKGFAHLVLLLVLGVAFVGGFYLYKQGYIQLNTNPNKNTAAVTSTPMPSTLVTNTQTYSMPNETVNWKVYTDTKYHFTFKYPADVQLKKNDVSVSLTKTGPTQKTEAEFYDALQIIFGFGNLQGKTLEEIVDADIQKGTEVSEMLKAKEAITFNDYEGFTFTRSGLGAYKHIYIKHPSLQIYIQIIDGTSDPSNQGFEKTVDQILSTFKFTN